jgi:hypothetical protein
MVAVIDPELKKINKSCTLEPRIDQAIVAYTRNPDKYVLLKDGYRVPPKYNMVIEIALRKLLGLPAPEGYPKSPDEITQ